ncbi:nicotinate (nicotinamide) nucleotide adenylyltransferase [Candidatus Mycoplasma haematohominis]|uniref:nicotinate (nicotinamide) nucleotide adenylyltransferase n=1 Tax=Candidatus Mycoplasma haematohominis TaxID=1494318 RepID=UPI001FE2B4D7|nr:nicotinate (nicotinamide) nucleotide adenylyltransferase [Candidatus Mycoplasma haemohominis]
MPKIKIRIGIFGGSFNPVHEGHINIAKFAIERLKLDELIFLPCFQSVDKTQAEYASPEHRVSMLLLVLPEKCSISAYEIGLGRPVETIETLRHFREIYKEAELLFILGEDNLETIDTWEEYKKLDEYARLVVFRRNNNKKPLTRGLRVTFMDNELWNYSSSSIREKDTSGLDIKVEVYIRENKLYGYVG